MPGRGGDDVSAKVTISYERTEELRAVLDRLGPMVRSYKVAKRRRGRFKRAYADLDVDKIGHCRSTGGVRET